MQYKNDSLHPTIQSQNPTSKLFEHDILSPAVLLEVRAVHCRRLNHVEYSLPYSEVTVCYRTEVWVGDEGLCVRPTKQSDQRRS